MLRPPLPMTRTFLTSTRLLPGFTTPLARYESAEGVFWASARRRRELEKERSCWERAGERTFCWRRAEAVDRTGWEEKDRRGRAERVSARHRWRSRDAACPQRAARTMTPQARRVAVQWPEGGKLEVEDESTLRRSFFFPHRGANWLVPSPYRVHFFFLGVKKNDC